jgi:hypothetical protein
MLPLVVVASVLDVVVPVASLAGPAWCCRAMAAYGAACEASQMCS